jgi:hypothetical protein
MSQENVDLLRRMIETFNRVRDGRMVRWQTFTTREAALEAVGLRE